VARLAAALLTLCLALTNHAHGEDLAASLLAGRTVLGRVHAPHQDKWLKFLEYFAPDGSLYGAAGPPDDPGRWRWTGRWSASGESICIAVPATNTRLCQRLLARAGGYLALIATGKGGARPGPVVVATIGRDGPPIRGWRVPALVALIAREHGAAEGPGAD
jgi:hypothetical protein